MGWAEIPSLTNWSLDQLEAHVAGRRLDPDLRRYLGQAHRVVNLGGVFKRDQPGSAGAGYISLEPPSQKVVESAKRRIREGKLRGSGEQERCPEPEEK